MVRVYLAQRRRDAEIFWGQGWPQVAGRGSRVNLSLLRPRSDSQSMRVKAPLGCFTRRREGAKVVRLDWITGCHVRQSRVAKRFRGVVMCAMTRQLGHHRKDGGAVGHRQSLVSVGRARIEVAENTKCLMSNYAPDKPLLPFSLGTYDFRASLSPTGYIQGLMYIDRSHTIIVNLAWGECIICDGFNNTVSCFK